jgi:hypothetical protein
MHRLLALASGRSRQNGKHWQIMWVEPVVAGPATFHRPGRSRDLSIPENGVRSLSSRAFGERASTRLSTNPD